MATDVRLFASRFDVAAVDALASNDVYVYVFEEDENREPIDAITLELIAITNPSMCSIETVSIVVNKMFLTFNLFGEDLQTSQRINMFIISDRL
jgi:hypothetical protein